MTAPSCMRCWRPWRLERHRYGLGDLAALERELFPPAPRTDPDDAPGLPASPFLGRVRCGNWATTGCWWDRLPTWARCSGCAAGVRPDVVWTDPPYGVEYVGKTKRR